MNAGKKVGYAEEKRKNKPGPTTFRGRRRKEPFTLSQQ